MNMMKNQAANTESYAWVRELQMTPDEREFALNVVRNTEAVVEAIFRARDAIRTPAGKIGKIDAKPVQLKHSH